MDWYLNVLKNYFGFGGRARRKEYWMFVLVNIIFYVRAGHSGQNAWLGTRRRGRHINGRFMGFWSLSHGGRYSSGVYMTPIARHGGYWCC
ncbi:Inner membrane protein yhaH [Citrobacter freundii]|nr:Inner membrane protein yhaH [Citrobacter freundii]